MSAPSVRGAAAWLVFGALGVAAPVTAQTFPFPLLARDPANALDAATGLIVLDPDPGRIAGLRAFAQVTLQDVVLGEAVVDLQLERLDLDALGFGFRVDGRPADGLLDGLDLSVWTGTVAGDPASDVVLGFSNRGSTGWIETDGERTHLLPRSAAGDWTRSVVLLGTDAELAARGLERPADACGLDELAARGGAHTVPSPTPPAGAADGGGGACDG